MAIFDNRSSFESILIGGAELTAPPANFNYDVSRYESYAISIGIIVPNDPPAPFSFDTTVQEADDTMGPFAAIENDKLIGGAFPTITEGAYPEIGDIMVTRGVLSTKQIINVLITLNVPAPGVFLSITLVGKLKISPSQIAEGTSVIA